MIEKPCGLRRLAEAARAATPPPALAAPEGCEVCGHAKGQQQTGPRSEWRIKYEIAVEAGRALWHDCQHDGPGICVHYRDLRVALGLPLARAAREGADGT
jgi:hypothetical protein